MNQVHRYFNRKIRSTRSLIERVIGLLKVRFRCLLGERQLRYNQTKVSYIVYACVTLHNFLITKRFNIMHDINENDLRNFHLNEVEIENIENVDNHATGVVRRNELMQFLHRRRFAQ